MSMVPAGTVTPPISAVTLIFDDAAYAIRYVTAPLMPLRRRFDIFAAISFFAPPPLSLLPYAAFFRRHYLRWPLYCCR